MLPCTVCVSKLRSRRVPQKGRKSCFSRMMGEYLAGADF